MNDDVDEMMDELVVLLWWLFSCLFLRTFSFVSFFVFALDENDTEKKSG